MVLFVFICLFLFVCFLFLFLSNLVNVYATIDEIVYCYFKHFLFYFIDCT